LFRARLYSRPGYGVVTARCGAFDECVARSAQHMGRMLDASAERVARCVRGAEYATLCYLQTYNYN